MTLLETMGEVALQQEVRRLRKAILDASDTCALYTQRTPRRKEPFDREFASKLCSQLRDILYR